MSSSRCRWALCGAKVEGDARYCARHQPRAEAKFNAYSKLYSAERRTYDKEALDFYHSREWRACRERVLQAHPICQRCQRRMANTVHHITPLKVDWGRRLQEDNLEAVCTSCHSSHELKAKNKKT